MTDKVSVLSDGHVIPRVYADATLEQKRIDAINRMGAKWLMHPSNFVQNKNLNKETVK